MRIAYKNLIDELPNSSMTCFSAITGYPLSNIKDQRLGMVYKSSETSSFSITFNLSQFTDEPINTIALLGHNLTTSASVIIDFNIEDSWPGTTSQVISYNDGIILKYFNTIDTDADYLLTETGSFLITEDGSFMVSEYGYTYAQLRINDSTNTDGFISIGRVWLGEYLNIDPSSLLDFKVVKKRSDTVIYGKDRQKFALSGVGWRKFNFDFPVTDKSMIESVITMFKTVGNYKSFIFCNFDSIRGYDLIEPCYVSIVGGITFTHAKRMRFLYSLELEEDL